MVNGGDGGGGEGGGRGARGCWKRGGEEEMEAEYVNDKYSLERWRRRSAKQVEHKQRNS